MAYAELASAMAVFLRNRGRVARVSEWQDLVRVIVQRHGLTHSGFSSYPLRVYQTGYMFVCGVRLRSFPVHVVRDLTL